jgi:hypothetical protein
MSRKTASWTDTFTDKDAASALPADDFTPSNGTSFGLDSFEFETPDGAGIDDAQRLPTTRGLSALPDGLVEPTAAPDDTEMTSDEEGFVLSQEDVGLPKEASIVNLDWLDPTQPQDPDRLPDNDATLDSVSQLEDAWNREEPVDGGQRVPARDLEIARYHEETREKVHSNLPGTVDEDAIREVALRTARRAHFGTSTDKLKVDLVAALGHDAARLKKLVAKLDSEHGLIGTVFVRASAFPGIRNGAWVKEIRRSCRTAHYVITDDATVASKLGMQMVSEVPWAHALAHYKPLLASAGYKVASGDPKEALRAAFLKGPKIAAPKESHLPVAKPVVASEDEAKAALKEAPEQQEAPATPEDKAAGQKHRAALIRLARWVKAELLTPKQARQIRDSGVGPGEMLKQASTILAAAKREGNYEGEGTRVSEDARVARQVSHADLQQKQAAVEGALTTKLQHKIVRAVKAGQLTKEEARRIVAMKKGATETDKILAAVIQHAQAQRVASAKPVEVAHYKGPVQKVAQGSTSAAPKVSSEMARVLKASEASGVAAGEISGLLRWAAQQMTEGLAGKDFDTLLKARFASPVLKATAPLLKEARAKHEGLSGHLYVDASAYASDKGSAGCEKHAAKHRANALKHVLAMSRCGGCVHKNANNVCAVYNKNLVTKLPVVDPAKYQREMIHLANASDAENTAALFNPQEYDLGAGELENVSVPESASPEQVSDILFGDGLDVGD